MPKILNPTGQELISALKTIGFVVIRQKVKLCPNET